MRRNSFKDFIIEQLAALSDFSWRPMFSGYGLYLGNNFFGIISGSQLFFKTNKVTKPKYQQLGMKPFAPSAKQILKNYYEVPARVLEDKAELKAWALESVNLN